MLSERLRRGPSDLPTILALDPSLLSNEKFLADYPDLTAFVAFGMEGFVMELRSIGSFIKMKLNRIVDRETLLASHLSTGPRRLRARAQQASQ